jgi:hypothetical protein
MSTLQRGTGRTAVEAPAHGAPASGDGLLVHVCWGFVSSGREHAADDNGQLHAMLDIDGSGQATLRAWVEQGNRHEVLLAGAVLQLDVTDDGDMLHVDSRSGSLPLKLSLAGDRLCYVASPIPALAGLRGGCYQRPALMKRSMPRAAAAR